MFHNVLSVSSCFTSGSRCFMMFHDVSHCFTSVSWCFTMFNNVLRCLVSHVTICIAASATAQPPIASGIPTTLQGSLIQEQSYWSLDTPVRMDWIISGGVYLVVHGVFKWPRSSKVWHHSHCDVTAVCGYQGPRLRIVTAAIKELHANGCNLVHC